ncbi:MAG: hypothetical protein HOW73_42935 [Polyangiaceae bacterium]|nr:hypothetical protein [Polyangiaceae bacterium]
MAASVALCVLGVACADPQLPDRPPEQGVYVTQTTTNRGPIAIAIAIENGSVVAYTCGGQENLVDHTRWLDGALDPSGTFSLDRDGVHLEGRVTDEGAEGTFVDAAGEEVPWSAAPVVGDDSGLYVGVDSGCSTGVVVVDDGDESPFVQGAWCNEQGQRLQVTPILPLELEAGAFEVRIDGLVPAKELVVRRIQ